MVLIVRRSWFGDPKKDLDRMSGGGLAQSIRALTYIMYPVDLSTFAAHKYVFSHISRMANVTLSVPEDVYRRMKRRRDVKWSEVAREAIVERLERLEGPIGFSASTSELAKLIAKSGIDLDDISVEDAIRYYRKMRELE